MAATIIITIIIAALFVLAARYTLKHGSACAKGGKDGKRACGRNCGSCPYHEFETRASGKNE